MFKNKEHVFKLVVGAEGHYCNDVGDPGGPTNWGITIHDLIKWRNGGNLTSSNYSEWTEQVKRLTLQEALAIYDNKYWGPVRGDELPSGIDLLVFDFGINAGPSVGVKKLQKSLGVAQDGVLGKATLSALWALPDFKALNNSYYDAKMAFYRGLHNWNRFGKGWTNRADKMKREAPKMFKPTAEEIPELPEQTRVLLGLIPAAPTQPEETSKVWS